MSELERTPPAADAAQSPSLLSRTNWKHIDALVDENIDTTDSPPLTEEILSKAKWVMPGERSPRPSVTVELALDPKILAWFQAQGQDYERRTQAALRLYAEAHDAVI